MNNFVKTLSIYFYCFYPVLAVSSMLNCQNVEIAAKVTPIVYDGQGERFVTSARATCLPLQRNRMSMPVDRDSLDLNMVGTILTATFTANEALMEDNLVVYLRAPHLHARH